jgi:hypothetical protein
MPVSESQEAPGPEVIEEPGTGQLEVWRLPTSQAFLRRLLTDLFENFWDRITFGPLIQGAAYEFRATQRPERIGYYDGYLTVDFGHSHFHVCIGENRGEEHDPTPPALAEHRRTGRAELFRRLNRDGTPDTWGLRLFNGRGEQQITLLFPNPFLTDSLKFAAPPDWGRLQLWDYVRREYMGLFPDARDRSGRRMIHP